MALPAKQPGSSFTTPAANLSDNTISLFIQEEQQQLRPRQDSDFESSPLTHQVLELIRLHRRRQEEGQQHQQQYIGHHHMSTGEEQLKEVKQQRQETHQHLIDDPQLAADIRALVSASNLTSSRSPLLAQGAAVLHERSAGMDNHEAGVKRSDHDRFYDSSGSDSHSYTHEDEVLYSAYDDGGGGGGADIMTFTEDISQQDGFDENDEELGGAEGGAEGGADGGADVLTFGDEYATTIGGRLEGEAPGGDQNIICDHKPFTPGVSINEDLRQRYLLSLNPGETFLQPLRRGVRPDATFGISKPEELHWKKMEFMVRDVPAAVEFLCALSAMVSSAGETPSFFSFSSSEDRETLDKEAGTGEEEAPHNNAGGECVPSHYLIACVNLLAALDVSDAMSAVPGSWRPVATLVIHFLNQILRVVGSTATTRRTTTKLEEGGEEGQPSTSSTTTTLIKRCLSFLTELFQCSLGAQSVEIYTLFTTDFVFPLMNEALPEQQRKSKKTSTVGGAGGDHHLVMDLVLRIHWRMVLDLPQCWLALGDDQIQEVAVLTARVLMQRPPTLREEEDGDLDPTSQWLDLWLRNFKAAVPIRRALTLTEITTSIAVEEEAEEEEEAAGGGGHKVTTAIITMSFLDWCLQRSSSSSLISPGDSACLGISRCAAFHAACLLCYSPSRHLPVLVSAATLAEAAGSSSRSARPPTPLWGDALAALLDRWSLQLLLLQQTSPGDLESFFFSDLVLKVALAAAAAAPRATPAEGGGSSTWVVFWKLLDLEEQHAAQVQAQVVCPTNSMPSSGGPPSFFTPEAREAVLRLLVGSDGTSWGSPGNIAFLVRACFRLQWYAQVVQYVTQRQQHHEEEEVLKKSESITQRNDYDTQKWGWQVYVGLIAESRSQIRRTTPTPPFPPSPPPPSLSLLLPLTLRTKQQEIEFGIFLWEHLLLGCGDDVFGKKSSCSVFFCCCCPPTAASLVFRQIKTSALPISISGTSGGRSDTNAEPEPPSVMDSVCGAEVCVENIRGLLGVASAEGSSMVPSPLRTSLTTACLDFILPQLLAELTNLGVTEERGEHQQGGQQRTTGPSAQQEGTQQQQQEPLGINSGSALCSSAPSLSELPIIYLRLQEVVSFYLNTGDNHDNNGGTSPTATHSVVDAPLLSRLPLFLFDDHCIRSSDQQRIVELLVIAQRILALFGELSL